MAHRLVEAVVTSVSDLTQMYNNQLPACIPDDFMSLAHTTPGSAGHIACLYRRGVYFAYSSFLMMRPPHCIIIEMKAFLKRLKLRRQYLI